MSKCAYCPSSGPFTREHIWPRSLIQKYDSLKTYNPKTNKYYQGDAVIKDVCSICNNEKLSMLDSYLSSLYDNFLGRIVEAGEQATIEFDYSLLLRSLLKISYNSTRASDNVASKNLLQTYANFIIDGGYCKTVMLQLQIVTSSRMMDLESGAERTIRPVMMRCALVAYGGPLAHRFCIRMIAINSFWFYLIIPYKDEPPHIWDELLHGLSDWATPTGILIEKTSTKLFVPVEKTTYFHSDLLGSLLSATGQKK